MGMPSADKDQVLSQRSDHLLFAVRDGPASDNHFLDGVCPILCVLYSNSGISQIEFFNFQTIFALESAMDMLAEKLGTDPLEFRRIKGVLHSERDREKSPRLFQCKPEGLFSDLNHCPWYST